MPKSYATTRNGASSSPTVYGSSVVTLGDEVDAVGAAVGCAAAARTAVSSVPNAPGSAPASRR